VSPQEKAVFCLPEGAHNSCSGSVIRVPLKDTKVLEDHKGAEKKPGVSKKRLTPKEVSSGKGDQLGEKPLLTPKRGPGWTKGPLSQQVRPIRLIPGTLPNRE